MARLENLGVDWHLPRPDGRGFMKRRVVTSTQAVSLSMRLIAGEQLTFSEACVKYAHLPDERELMDVFISHGHGDLRMDAIIEPETVP